VGGETVEDTPVSPRVSTTTEQAGVKAEPLVLTAEMLTPGQRAVLESFGMGDTKVEITDEVYACVQDALGEARLGEVIGGSAPSPLEALRIAGCLTK
jgi:hypothetical protein